MADEKLVETMADAMARAVTGYLRREALRAMARAALAAAREAGYAIVPREPTPEMVRAGDAYTNCGGECGNRSGRNVYRAMLSAAEQ